MSAVASVTSAGVYPIAIFRSVAACISIWSTPTEYVEITLTEGETRLKNSASSLSNGVIRIASAPSAAVSSSSRVKDVPSPLRRTSYSLLILVSTGLMKCDVTTKTGFFINCVLPKRRAFFRQKRYSSLSSLTSFAENQSSFLWEKELDLESCGPVGRAIWVLRVSKELGINVHRQLFKMDD